MVEAQTDTIGLLTFNIAHGRGLSLYQGFSSSRRIHKNLSRIANLINSTGAHIIALQEVDDDSHWNKNINLFSVLKKGTALPHGIHGVTNIREGKKPLSYGNAILSRYPVRKWHNQPFGDADLGEKGFLYAELDLNGHFLPVVNLHLDFRSRKRRLGQIEKLIAFLQARWETSPFSQAWNPIICGDFNSTSEKAGDAIRHLFEYVWTRADYTLYPLKAKTFPSHWPRRGIDFVFLPSSFPVVGCEVMKSYLSDHRPVLVRFKAGTPQAFP